LNSDDKYVIDLKTLTSVLTLEALTFQSACEIFGVPASKARATRPGVTKPKIEALLKDVTAALELLHRLKPEFERHPVDLAPELCYSPATLDTTYFSALGIKPPQQQFNIPHGIHGIPEQALFGGRAECTIRRTLLPLTYLDFHAQYPAVGKLLDCREILCAESLEFADFNAGAREMVERTTVDDCFRPEFWKRSRWFALVEPHEQGTHHYPEPTFLGKSGLLLLRNNAASDQAVAGARGSLVGVLLPSPHTRVVEAADSVFRRSYYRLNVII
jgi:hypothetical protein